MSNEIEIDYLPIMGKPESIKTRKQGAKRTLASLANADGRKVDTQKTYGRRGVKRIFDARILAYRILRFEKSTASQIHLSRNFIKEIEVENLDRNNMPEQVLCMGNKIIGINMFLFKKYKEYREI